MRKQAQGCVSVWDNSVSSFIKCVFFCCPSWAWITQGRSCCLRFIYFFCLFLFVSTWATGVPFWPTGPRCVHVSGTVLSQLGVLDAWMREDTTRGASTHPGDPSGSFDSPDTTQHLSHVSHFYISSGQLSGLSGRILFIVVVSCWRWNDPAVQQLNTILKTDLF